MQTTLLKSCNDSCVILPFYKYWSCKIFVSRDLPLKCTIMSISEKIREINSKLPEGTSLVAISKFHPAEAVKEAYDAGQRVFGESREQELVEKHAKLPKDIVWHFIGHLQTNKVKNIVPIVSLIHSVDSVHLLSEIDRQAAKVGRKIDCLIELHVAKEETKYGFDLNEAEKLFVSGELAGYQHVNVRGLMAMATNSDDMELVRSEFRQVSELFSRLKAMNHNIDTLSMGMTADWPIAVEEGSTLVRIGSYIFGERVY